ncbi:hypothetical protein [Enterococcus sp. N249-2]
MIKIITEKRFRELYQKFSLNYQNFYDNRPVIFKTFLGLPPMANCSYFATFNEPTFLSDEDYQLYKLSKGFNLRSWGSSYSFIRNPEKSVIWNMRGFNRELKEDFEKKNKEYFDEIKCLSERYNVSVTDVNNDEIRIAWREKVEKFLKDSLHQLLFECDIVERDYQATLRNFRCGNDGYLSFGAAVQYMTTMSKNMSGENLTPYNAKKVFRDIYMNREEWKEKMNG